ncbi:hypothetical protein SCHPADRAFT_894259 [Schizopora paradoxa]|uniref:Uncharacterized protein n=1 Tax=Schizopora paradoxa TaxID=27342 RepID=A0A0H2REK5_9AGAM|nr:hypothetical protein SCHPADRAFT_894259 [Schizopora paradoxa]
MRLVQHNYLYSSTSLLNYMDAPALGALQVAIVPASNNNNNNDHTVSQQPRTLARVESAQTAPTYAFAFASSEEASPAYQLNDVPSRPSTIAPDCSTPTVVLRHVLLRSTLGNAPPPTTHPLEKSSRPPTARGRASEVHLKVVRMSEFVGQRIILESRPGGLKSSQAQHTIVFKNKHERFCAVDVQTSRRQDVDKEGTKGWRKHRHWDWVFELAGGFAIRKSENGAGKFGVPAGWVHRRHPSLFSSPTRLKFDLSLSDDTGTRLPKGLKGISPGNLQSSKPGRPRRPSPQTRLPGGWTLERRSAT